VTSSAGLSDTCAAESPGSAPDRSIVSVWSVQLPEDATDEELYQWFIRSLGGNGSAVEVRPDVIRVEVVESDSDAVTTDATQPPDHLRTVWVHITREQLRSVAWSEFNIFDDTDPDVIPRTDTPVWMGLITFDFYTEESLATMRPGEDYLVFHEGALRPSTTPEAPPVRSHDFW
jgi:hypothetical protein